MGSGGHSETENAGQSEAENTGQSGEENTGQSAAENGGQFSWNLHYYAYNKKIYIFNFLS